MFSSKSGGGEVCEPRRAMPDIVACRPDVSCRPPPGVPRSRHMTYPNSRGTLPALRVIARSEERMPVIDAHQHFWNLERVSYPWLTPDLAPIYRNFDPPDLEPLLPAAGVDRTVVAQAADSHADTDARLARVDSHPWIAAVVGWVPLNRPDEAAAAIGHYRAHPAFAGVRHLIHDDPDPDWVVRDSVIEGLRILAAADLTFDLVGVLPRHLEHVITLAERVPGLRMVIDHLNKP